MDMREYLPTTTGSVKQCVVSETLMVDLIAVVLLVPVVLPEMLSSIH